MFNYIVTENHIMYLDVEKCNLFDEWKKVSSCEQEGRPMSGQK